MPNGEITIAERTANAAKEMKDISKLFTNDVDNKDEIISIITESVEGGRGLYQLFKHVPGTADRALAGAIVSHASSEPFVQSIEFSDGSKMSDHPIPD